MSQHVDSLLTAAACDFCDLREELTMFFTTLIAVKCMMKCHALFQDQLHFQPDSVDGGPCDLMFLNCLSPIDSECHVASSSLPTWGPIMIMTTLVTAQRDKCRLHKPLGRFSRKIEQLEFLALLTFLFFSLMLGCAGSVFKSLLCL